MPDDPKKSIVYYSVTYNSN